MVTYKSVFRWKAGDCKRPHLTFYVIVIFINNVQWPFLTHRRTRAVSLSKRPIPSENMRFVIGQRWWLIFAEALLLRGQDGPYRIRKVPQKNKAARLSDWRAKGLGLDYPFICYLSMVGSHRKTHAFLSPAPLEGSLQVPWPYYISSKILVCTWVSSVVYASKTHKRNIQAIQMP